MALAYTYLYVDNAPLPEDWDIGKEGYVETLHVRLNVPIGSKSRMKSDLLVIAACHANGESYSPNIRYSMSHGKPALVQLDSVVAQIIADATQIGMSGRLTQQLVNMHCLDNNEEPYSLSNVRTAIDSLQPCIAVSTRILTASSGDTSSTPAFWKKTTFHCRIETNSCETAHSARVR